MKQKRWNRKSSIDSSNDFFILKKSIWFLKYFGGLLNIGIGRCANGCFSLLFALADTFLLKKHYFCDTKYHP